MTFLNRVLQGVPKAPHRHLRMSCLLAALFAATVLTELLPAAIALAQTGAAAPAASAPAGTPTGGTPFELIFGTVQFFLLAFFVYYMLVLRPQQVKEEEQARFFKELKKDDEVITAGGLFGKVVTISEGFLTLEVAQGVRVKVHPLFVSAPDDSTKPVGSAKDSDDGKNSRQKSLAKSK